jgi:hypothetical protein
MSTAALKDPMTYQACAGAGIGPWFWCGQARQTGEVIAWPCYGVTQLFWDENRAVHADTVQGIPEAGEVVGIQGFAWKVHWTDEAKAEAARQAEWSARPCGANLALAQSAVAERIADNPRTVDWFGAACALTDARVRDLNAGAA